MKPSHTRALVAVLVLTLAAYVYVMLRWSANFYADDSYFYFQVAWNIARGMGSTFNNIMPTNGYHPLWMLVCVAVFKCVSSKAAFLRAIIVVICLFDLAALFLLTRIVERTARGFWWASLLLFLPFAMTSQLGTEGALSGLLLAALVLATFHLAETPSPGRAFLFALCGALAVLARLDNVFVVGLIFIATFLSTAPLTRRFMLMSSPIFILLWGLYIASNLHWFGTIEPISGLLKAHSHGHHNALASLPHIGMVSLAVILPSILILARFRRDLFFRTVELPFAAGVLIHACYIMFVLSSETRWSWYYTSWALLASILFARVLSVLLADPRRHVLIEPLAWATVLLLCVTWYRSSYKPFSFHIDENDGTLYLHHVDKTGVKTVIAFDKPGRLAFYSGIRVIALDGLMGDLAFQHQLATEGIAAYDAENHVDGFVGPPQPVPPDGYAQACNIVILSTTRFHCTPIPAGFQQDSVEVFARLTGTPAGTLPLPPSKLLWNVPTNIAIWALPTAGPYLRQGPPITSSDGTH